MNRPAIIPQPNPYSADIRSSRRTDVGRPDRYDRDWDLPRLLPMWPHELADLGIAGRERVVAKIKQALRAERRRGVSGHWTYDLTRHAQLVAACRHEADALASARAAARRPTHGLPIAAE